MPTINSKKLVDEIIANEGFYSDDPRVTQITEYTNQWGGISYGMDYDNRNAYVENPPYVNNPKILFRVEE